MSQYQAVGVRSQNKLFATWIPEDCAPWTDKRGALADRERMTKDGVFGMVFIRQSYGNRGRFRVLHKLTWIEGDAAL